MKQDGPRRLQQRVERHALCCGQLTQGRRLLPGQPPFPDALDLGRPLFVRRGAVDDERCGRREARQAIAPVPLGGAEVQPAKELDVLAVWTRRAHGGHGPRGHGIVEGEQFAQHEGKRPPVEQGVVKRPHDAMLIWAVLDDDQPHAGGMREIDAAGTVQAKRFVET
jgi:hypothetical protein